MRLGHLHPQFRPGHTFLFMRIGAGDRGCRRAGAAVEGQMGHVGGDLEDVDGGEVHCVLKGLAPVHDGDTLAHVGRFRG